MSLNQPVSPYIKLAYLQKIEWKKLIIHVSELQVLFMFIIGF